LHRGENSKDDDASIITRLVAHEKDPHGHRQKLAPRLLTRGQAAFYCTVSVSTFEAICPVRPVALGKGKRMERYDIIAIDEWIDRLGGGGASSRQDWLATLGSTK